MLMAASTHKIVNDALLLPPSARAYVAEKLIESLDVIEGSKISPEWKAEIKKRCKEIDKGTIKLKTAEEVFRKAYKALG